MAGSKIAKVRRLDLPVPLTGGGGTPLVTEAAAPEQPIPTPAAPFGLAVAASGIERGGPSPSAYVRLTWFPAAGTPASATFELQYSTAADFSVAAQTKTTTNPGEWRGLSPTVTYYFRVRAVVAGRPGAWSAAISYAVGSASEVPPPAPTGLAASWSGRTGNLTISCTPPTGANVQGVRFRIYAASGGTLLRTAEAVGGLFTWTLDMQRLDRGAITLPAAASCYIVANAYSWVGNLSSDVTLSATLAPPAAPLIVSPSWPGVAPGPGASGTQDEDLSVQIAAPSPPLAWRVVADDVQETDVPTATSQSAIWAYPYTLNKERHSGTADPAISVQIRGVDALGQTGSAYSATLYNYPPPATTITADAGVVGTVVLRIAASAAQDLRGYRVRVYKDGSELTSRAFETANTIVSYDALDGAGSYQFSVSPVDLFGQYATESALTTPLDLAPITLDEVREDVTYTDSPGTAPATLKAQLADDVRSSGGVVYAGGAWRWTETDWQRFQQAGNITISASGGTGYVGISTDGATYAWFAGPVTSSVLTYIGAGAVGSSAELAAQAAAASLPLVAGSQYWKVPGVREARYVRLGHTSVSGFTLYEYYPRRKIVADDILGEIIRGITIEGTTINGGTINGAVITGAIIQTAASGERVVLDADGLKTYNASGQIVIEASTATDGALRTGTGLFSVDRTNLNLKSDVDPGGSYLGGGLTLVSPFDETAAVLYTNKPFDLVAGTVDLQLFLDAPAFRVGGLGGYTSISSSRVGTQYLDVSETTEANPAANTGRVLARDVGGLTHVGLRQSNGAYLEFSSQGRIHIAAASTTDNTAASAGGVAEYLIVSVNGVSRKIPLHST